MKIKSIGISNALSFAHRNDLATNPDIIFDVAGTNGSLNILIGPNGSGKSNFVEVLNQVFHKALFLATKVDESHLMRRVSGAEPSTAELKNTLTLEQNQNNWGVAPHRNSTNKDRKIRIVLGLNDHDLSNLSFLLKNSVVINQLLREYCNPDISLIENARSEVLQTYTEVTLLIDSTSGPMAQLALENEGDSEAVFIKQYLVYFRLLQSLIKMYNHHIKKDTDPEWPKLHETFVMLGSYRNYAGIDGNIPVDPGRSLYQVDQRIRSQSTRSSDSGEPAAFEFVKRVIGNRFCEIFDANGRETALELLYKEEPLVSINKFLSEYLSIKIRVNKLNLNDMSLEMLFVGGDGRRVVPDELSSGEKGILHFIFTICGFDLKNGVVVIDEPELHLHPQMQYEYLKIIEDVRRKFDIQFILVTHSPIFVNQTTIDHVYRFTLKDGATKTIKPSLAVSEKNLTRILDLTNSAKIFFVSKAILVEGETDEYFLRFFIDQLQAMDSQSGPDAGLNWRNRVGDFEIFNIKGKGGRETWTKFLTAFGLQVYFIGDWDNITEVASYDLKTYEAGYLQATQIAAKAISQKGSTDGVALFDLIDLSIGNPVSENLEKLRAAKDYIVSRHYPYATLVEHLKQNEQTTWKRIESDIESAYSNRIFILKLGELEDYIPLIGKGLEHLIEFCRQGYSDWLVDDKYAEHRTELENICAIIFTDSQDLGGQAATLGTA